jgi:fatty acid/phospholipid biosynthesis enzyme
MKLGLDVMGGDFAPDEALIGLQEALEHPDLEDVQLVAFGQEGVVSEFFQKKRPHGQNSICAM